MALMHPGGARRPPGAPRLALLARTWPAELSVSTALGRCGVEGCGIGCGDEGQSTHRRGRRASWTRRD